MAVKSGKRELIDTGRDKRFVKRREDGRFKESDDVGRSLAADRRSTSENGGKVWLRRSGRSTQAGREEGYKEHNEKGGEESRKKVDAQPMPTSVVPMLATKVGAPFSRAGWIFEPKWDGYRAICYLHDGVVRFASRNQRNFTHRFPELQNIAKSIKASSAVIDGEIVALDTNGGQCFEKLQNHGHSCFIIFFAFDLLFLDGESLTELPLIERKAKLKQILPRRQSARIRFTDYIVERGLDLFAALEAQLFEGMVGKRADSLYVPGRSKEWLKVKTRFGTEEMKKRIESWGHR